MSVDSGALFLTTGAVTLTDGYHRLVYLSVDNAENVERPNLFSAYWGVPVDTQPPVTTPAFVGPSQGALGFFILRAGTSVQLTARDYPIASYSVGVDSTYYLMDVNPSSCTGGAQVAFPDPSQPPGSCLNPLYQGPFAPSPGNHVLYFWSIDRAGNAETAKSISLEVGALSLPGATGNDGLGIGLDSNNLLWSILFDSGTVGLAHNGANGVFTGSTTLAGADPAFPWAMFFDAGGNAYAVGAATAPNGSDQLAIYQAAPSGSAIVSARTFDSGYNNNNLIFGVSAPGWIVGSVQTSGPISLAVPGTRSYALAVWGFNPANGSIQLATTYSRAGFDVATGVTSDAAGNLWISGFSMSPNPLTPRVFDLALWKYASDGRTLLAGPFLRPGYLSNFDTTQLAEVAISSGVVYVAAPHERVTGGTDMALVAFDAATGKILAESAWRPGDGSSEFSSALLQDRVGRIVAVGGFDYGATTTAGLWRYGGNGALISATQVDVGGARGAIYNGPNLWLTVDGSTSPVLVSTEAAINGALTDILPPRSSLQIGYPSAITDKAYVSTRTTIGLLAVDDAFAIGDGLGAGVARTFDAVDGSTFSLFTSSFQLVVEGTHTISFYSVDLAGNAEVIKSSVVAVDLTPPVATLVSSGATYSIQAYDPIVNGVASGVAGIRYLIDVSPDSCSGGQAPTAPSGTCANPIYVGPFTLSIGTHTIYYQAIDNVHNGDNVVLSSTVVVGPPQLPIVIVSTTALPGAVAGLAVTPLGNFRYVAVGGQILRQNLEGRTLGAFGGFGAAGPGMLVADAREGLWAADPSNRKLLRMDPRGNVVRATSGPLASIAGAGVYSPNDPVNLESIAVADETSGSVALFDLGGGPVLTIGPGMLTRPRGVVVTPSSALYVVDAASAQVLVLDTNFKLVRRFGAGLRDPDQIALAADGSVWVSDRADHALHVFDSSGNTVGVGGGIGQGVLDFSAVRGLAFDPAGRLHVADGSRVLALMPQVSTGTGPILGGLSVAAQSPWAVNLAVAAPSPRAALYELRVSSRPIATDADFVAADVAPVGFVPSAPGASDILRVPGLSPGGTYYFALRSYDASGRVSNTQTLSAATPTSLQKGTIATVAGFGAFGWLGDGWPATLASLGFPRGVAEDAAGNLYVTDGVELFGNDVEHTARVRRIDAATKVITTIAGGVPGFAGDGGPALSAQFSNMRGIAADSAGNLYIGDAGNSRIRKISTSGIVTTFAGNGQAGYSGDGGPAVQAMLNQPRFLTVAQDGSAIFADTRNNRIRRVDAQTGIITTIAGNGQRASTGDGGPATQASLNFTNDVTVSLARTGDVYVSEANGNRVRKIDGRTGIITTVAGNGVAASAGDGGPATAASINGPLGMALDPVDNLYIAEFNGSLVRRVDARTGVITTVGGNGVSGPGGEDGPALRASVADPAEMRLDAPAGVLYFADPGNARVSALAVDPFLSSTSTQTVGGQPAVAAVSTAPYTLTQASTQTPQGAVLIASAAAQGLAPVSQVYIVSPTGQPGATIELTFTVPAGVSTNTLAIYHFNGVSWDSAAVTAQTITLVNGFYQITGLAMLTSPFAVFQRDATPPITALTVSTPSAGAYISGVTRLSLTAVDPLVDGFASGVAFTRYRINGGAFTQSPLSFRLSGPDGPYVLDYQSQDVAGNLEVLRSTSVLLDQTPPVTSVSVGSPSFTANDGTLYVATTSPVSFAAVDPALSGSTVPGSGVNRIEVSVDSAPWTPYVAALTFAEGRHTILYRAVDNVGNVEAAHTLALSADATPPVSSLVIGAPQFALSSATVLVSSLTPLGIAAVDPVSSGVASGVRQSFYGVNGGTFAVFAASFTFSGVDGPQTVSFYSQDNVLNTEGVKISTVLLDSTPPEVALLSPASCDAGICRLLKGRFQVLGTARDAHFAGYVIDFAPGQNATTGYALISSGTAAVSAGALGIWDASALSGWQTLRLTATDLVANVSVLAINVYVGDPAALMLLGNHDTFNMPTGVAVGGDGKIYVADRDNDRVAVFSSTGTLLASFGARDDDDRDDVRRSTGVLRLNKPMGVAVDAAGDVFVADTGRDRVLELSATGQVLLAIGRKQAEFNKPTAVALDGRGDIYVSDTQNHRVQVFSSTGGFLSQIVLPAVPQARDADDRREREDRDGDERSALGKPMGLALDASGRLYVADAAGHRVLEYGAAGNLLLTIPIPGDKPGQPSSPFGVAVSTSGDCLLVSDARFGHVRKFDFTGAQNLIFGARAGGGDDDKRKPAGIAFRKLAGLALDASGNLYAADRNAEKIEKFGLPTGRPTLVVPPARPDDDDHREVARDVLERDSGGKVERRDHAGVSVPAGALADDLKITVSTMSQASAAQSDTMGKVADGKGLKPAYAPIEYGPEGTKFAASVTLTVPYNPQLVAQQGLSEDSLKVHYWNKSSGDWEALESVVDKAARTVTAKTPHFSLYQVLGSTGGAGIGVAAADASFGLKAAYAFPNPVHAGGVTIRLQPGLADSVSVRVYDVSGRKVHDSSAFTMNPSLDDGNGLGAQYTYDHVWDVSGVGSGVYTYVITATKSGQTDIHKTGRIGVAK